MLEQRHLLPQPLKSSLHLHWVTGVTLAVGATCTLLATGTATVHTVAAALALVGFTRCACAV